jgi:1-deoxy-D-xylulose-5-phosphate synthase
MGLSAAFQQDHPVAVRYPRGAGVGADAGTDLAPLPWGKGELRREIARPVPGERIAILAFGTLLYPALAAADKLDAAVANMRFAKPLDTELLAELARRVDAIVTVEEGCIMGGAGSAVMEALHAAGFELPVLSLGLADEFSEHGDPARLLAQMGLDAAGIERSVRERFLVAEHSGSRLSAA